MTKGSPEGYQWWVEELPVAGATYTPPISSGSAIGNINLSDYLPKPGVYADPLFAEPIALEDAFDRRMLADLERDKQAGKIADFQLYDGMAQDTQHWQTIKTGRDCIVTPLYLVLVSPVAEPEF